MRATVGTLVVTLGFAVGCGSGDEQFAAYRGADGSCPVPLDGAWTGSAVIGSNSCGVTPGHGGKSTVFIGGTGVGNPAMIKGTVQHPTVCATDIDAVVDGTRLTGTYEFASDRKFRFIGTTTDSTCTANVTLTYTKN